MKQLVIWLKDVVTHILAVFKSKNTEVIMPVRSISKSQRINEIMSQPEVQKLKNELTISQGNEFLEMLADNSNSNKQSTTTTKNVELEDAIDKQKQFLRKFI